MSDYTIIVDEFGRGAADGTNYGRFGCDLTIGQRIETAEYGPMQVREIGATIHTGSAGQANYVYIWLEPVTITAEER